MTFINVSNVRTEFISIFLFIEVIFNWKKGEILLSFFVHKFFLKIISRVYVFAILFEYFSDVLSYQRENKNMSPYNVTLYHFMRKKKQTTFLFNI